MAPDERVPEVPAPAVWDGSFETLPELLARLKIGREEAFQRQLTTLIVNGPYPRWNSRSKPSAAGVVFLRTLHDACFGGDWPGDDLLFVDELELPGRTDDEKGGAPDYAVIWPDRLWLIELKTEAASHRATQIPLYFELARHHHPDRAIDLTYLTSPMRYDFTVDQPWARFAHITWDRVQELIRWAWPAPSAPGQLEVVDGLCRAIGQLDLSPSEWRSSVLAAQQPYVTGELGVVVDPVDEAVALAASTAADGEQRGLDFDPGSLDGLLDIRLAVRDRLAASPADSPLRCVLPWLWRTESLGRALTDAGRRNGYELRLSRYRTAQY